MWLKLLAALLVAVTGTGVGLYYASEGATAPAGTTSAAPPAAGPSPCCAARMKRLQEQESAASSCDKPVGATASAAGRDAFAACTGAVSLAGLPTTKAVNCCEE